MAQVLRCEQACVCSMSSDMVAEQWLGGGLDDSEEVTDDLASAAGLIPEVGDVFSANLRVDGLHADAVEAEMLAGEDAGHFRGGIRREIGR